MTLFVPAGFAHGFLTTEPKTDVLYQISEFFTPDAGRGIRWDDPAIGFAAQPPSGDLDPRRGVRGHRASDVRPLGVTTIVVRTAAKQAAARRLTARMLRSKSGMKRGATVWLPSRSSRNRGGTGLLERLLLSRSADEVHVQPVDVEAMARPRRDI